MIIKTQFDGQLMYASIKITYRGISKVIDRLVVDTGAAKSFISIDVVEDINISFDNEDSITTVYGVGGPDNSFEKVLDSVEFGSKIFYNYKIDFGSFHGDYDMNGLIGLDILKDSKVIIDLKDMTIKE